MTLKELEPQLLSLTPPDKAQAIQILAESLAQKTPGTVGGNARIAGTRISIWGLVESRRLGATDAQLLEDYPHLSASDLKNAWAYAEAFPDEIEAAIKLNDID
ncbi:DUF433 domain-containing protein [Microcoleus sp. herbarium14]|uniref:DUF433 domain-containing protein n=1 Tax=Microcoleus sp. herbarium14 TaxID=3055439 RepID=UPI002FD408E0